MTVRGTLFRTTAALLSVAGFGSGCGYALQTSKSVQLEAKGVRTIYVAPVENNTYKIGIDNLVYNELIQVLSAHGTLRLARRPEDADAVLRSSVERATSSPRVPVRADTLFPTEPVLKDNGQTVNIDLHGILVATEYEANLGARFVLERNHPKPGEAEIVWTASFSREWPFPANNQLGIFGNTSPLINDSEFDQALRRSAERMMADVHESMLAVF